MTKRPGPGSDGSYSNVFGKLKETGRSLLKSDPTAVKQATALAAVMPGKWAAISREVGRSAATVSKYARLESGATQPSMYGHGGARRDILGDQGRDMLQFLVESYPKLRDEMYAMLLGLILKDDVKAFKTGLITANLERMMLTKKVTTAIYRECLTPAILDAVKTFSFLLQIATLIYGMEWLDKTDFLDVKGWNAKEMQSTTGRSFKGSRCFDVAVSDRASTAFFGCGKHIDFMAAVNRKHGLTFHLAYAGHTTLSMVLEVLETLYFPICRQNGVERVVLDHGSYWNNTANFKAAVTPLAVRFGIELLWLPTRLPLLNPEERLNGWLERQVKKDVDEGRGSLAEPIKTIYDCIRRNKPSLDTMCKHWVDGIMKCGGPPRRM